MPRYGHFAVANGACNSNSVFFVGRKNRMQERLCSGSSRGLHGWICPDAEQTSCMPLTAISAEYMTNRVLSPRFCLTCIYA